MLSARASLTHGAHLRLCSEALTTQPKSRGCVRGYLRHFADGELRELMQMDHFRPSRFINHACCQNGYPDALLEAASHIPEGMHSQPPHPSPLLLTFIHTREARWR